MELTSTFDNIRKYTYRPVQLTFGEEDALVAILTDCRAEGSSDISLSLRFDAPMYGHIAKRLGRACVLSIEGEIHNCRLHAVHPESVNVVAITVRVK